MDFSRLVFEYSWLFNHGSFFIGLFALILSAICLVRCVGFNKRFRNATDFSVMLLLFLSMSACAVSMCLRALHTDQLIINAMSSLTNAYSSEALTSVLERLSVVEDVSATAYVFGALLIAALILNILSVIYYVKARSAKRMFAAAQKMVQKIAAQSE